jgi:hypothetical protein
MGSAGISVLWDRPWRPDKRCRPPRAAQLQFRPDFGVRLVARPAMLTESLPG